MTPEIMVAVIAAVQGITAAWLNWQVRRNGCGGKRCFAAMVRLGPDAMARAAYNDELERTPGAVAVKQED